MCLIFFLLLFSIQGRNHSMKGRYSTAKSFSKITIALLLFSMLFFAFCLFIGLFIPALIITAFIHLMSDVIFSYIDDAIYKSCWLPNMAFLICVNIFKILLCIVYYICMYIYSLLFFPARLYSIMSGSVILRLMAWQQWCALTGKKMEFCNFIM